MQKAVTKAEYETANYIKYSIMPKAVRISAGGLFMYSA